MNHESIGLFTEQISSESQPDFYEYRKKVEAQSIEPSPIAPSSAEFSKSAEREANFNKFVNFFNRDAAIKSTLVDLTPSEIDAYGNAGADYSDRLYQGFEDIEHKLHGIMKDYYPSPEIEKRLKAIKQDVTMVGGNFNNFLNVYRRDFSNMSEDFIKATQKETIGYLLHRDPHSLDARAHSINEMLHLIHSAIVNDETILHGLPILAKNESDWEYGVTLYGTKETFNPIALQIFDGFKDNPDAMVDIVSLKDRILMMVRDSGHALTLDAQKDPDGKHYIKYFIPKICNVDKVNRLPGVRKVSKKLGARQVNDSTTGLFSIDANKDVAGTILDFIAAVPTDSDIEYY